MFASPRDDAGQDINMEISILEAKDEINLPKVFSNPQDCKIINPVFLINEISDMVT